MIYLHIPFCRSFCNYCGFYSCVAQLGKADYLKYEQYTQCILNEIDTRSQEILASCSCLYKHNNTNQHNSVNNTVDTLYIGGGTPSALPTEMLIRIIDEINSLFPTHHKFEEFTIEVNPEDIIEKGEEFIALLIDKGVNRVSMGVQSFDDKILRWMNRRHNAQGAINAINIIRNAGIQNINIDLIFGYPMLSNTLWVNTINTALRFCPEHISAYQLSIDDNSSLANLVNKGKFKLPSDEVCRKQYDILCLTLHRNGYDHYEISNFALPNKQAVHNSAYWKRYPYVGIGPGAHSLKEDRIRIANAESIPYAPTVEVLTDEDIKIEQIMLGLRTSKGIKKSYIYNNCDANKIDYLLKQGILQTTGNTLNNIRITEDNFFISDQIISELI